MEFIHNTLVFTILLVERRTLDSLKGTKTRKPRKAILSSLASSFTQVRRHRCIRINGKEDKSLLSP